MPCFAAQTTRSAGSEKSTSMLKPSRLKLSSAFKSRNWRPSVRRSAMKSIDQTRGGASGTAEFLGRVALQPSSGLIAVVPKLGPPDFGVFRL